MSTYEVMVIFNTFKVNDPQVMASMSLFSRDNAIEYAKRAQHCADVVSVLIIDEHTGEIIYEQKVSAS